MVEHNRLLSGDSVTEVFKSSIVLSDLLAFLLSQFHNKYGAKMYCTAEEINFNARNLRPSVGTEPPLTSLQRLEVEQCSGSPE